ncbi:LysR family transcriptional regulator [Vibrio sp. CDRSL-10 TSBA]
MHNKDIQVSWLKAFVAVVDSGSLTSAAKQICRSQSAVSMQIKKLEDCVGRSLLNRGPHHMSLTPAGADLLRHARKILDANAQAWEMFHDGTLVGQVNIGIPDDYAMAYLPSVLRTFTSRYSGIDITLVCEHSTALIPKVERNELDIAVITRDAPNRGELLFKEELVWVAGQQHDIWMQEPLPIAVHELGSRIRAEVLTAISAQERKYRIVYQSPNVAGQIAVAESGMAIAVLTRCSLPLNLKVLDKRHGMPDLPELEVAIIRSPKSLKNKAADIAYEQIISVLKHI